MAVAGSRKAKTVVRVLFVEDSRRLQDYVAEGLRQAGYVVDLAGDGEEGLWAAESSDYDAVILDIILPKLDGLSLLERLRAQGNQSNVLMLTAKDTVEDRVEGLSRGADDYLVKPFALEELLARVDALTRRAHGVRNPVISVGPLTIDTARRTVRRKGETLFLAPREYGLLELLALQMGKVVSRTDIEHRIYDDRCEPVSNVVDVAICRLRKLVDEPGSPSLIETRRGMGYILQEPER